MSFVLLLLAGQNPVGALFFGALIGIVGQVGDLAESMLKRAASVEDSAT